MTVAPGHGWTEPCVFHPERTQPPLEVFDRVAELARGRRSAAAMRRPRRGRPTGPARARRGERRGGPRGRGVPIRETAVGQDDPSGGFFGVLAEPVGPAGDLCAVFLNAGAVRRIGPNRMWVEASRRWAARGIPTLRVDVEGIGDANGDAACTSTSAASTRRDRGGQVTAIIDALEARGLGPRFALIGLCAGAFSAFTAGAVDRRVVEALSVNPRVLIWDPALLVAARGRPGRTACSTRRSWQRILRGEYLGRDRPGDRSIGGARGGEGHGSRRGAIARASPRGSVGPASSDGMLDRLRDTDTRLVLAFAGDEPINDELETDGVLARLDRWPNIDIADLPGADHTLRPIAAQRAFHQLVDRELDQLTARD